MSATSKEGLFAVCGSFFGLSTIAVSLRFYSRRYQRLALRVDDWSALFGVVTYIVAAALGIEQAVLGGFGYGTMTGLTPAQRVARAKTTVQLAFAYDWFNLNTLACAKISALFMYRRIFTVDRNGWFNRVIIGTVVVVALWYISSDILSLLQCGTHFSASWDGHFKEYCTLNPVWAKELAYTDFLLDLWILMLPIPPIMRLHTTLAKKLSIFGVFLLAFIGLGASIARIVFFSEAKAPGQATLYIGLLESGISITVVNLPAIYYLCTSVIPDGVARSLRSIRSLGSQDSSGSRSMGNTQVPNDDEQEQSPVAKMAVEGKSASWSSQGSACHGNQTDVEAGRGETYEMHKLDEDSMRRHSQGRIHVQSDVEVRRE